MRRRPIVVGVLLILSGFAAWAAEWEETDSGIDIVVDYKTGLPAVVFHVALEYASPPESYHVNTSWEIFAILEGSEVPLDGFSSTSIRSGEVRRIYSVSPRVPIEGGERYGARVTITDSAHDLSYTKTFDFLAPPAVPFGIRLTGWDGSDDADLSELPGEELEELVLLHDLLGGYSRVRESVSVTEFLRGDAAGGDFPLSLLLLPTANIDTSGSPVKLSVVLSLFVYTLPASSEIGGVLDQLEQFDQEFIGEVYAGAGSAVLGGGKTIFVQDSVRVVLEAAASEASGR